MYRQNQSNFYYGLINYDQPDYFEIKPRKNLSPEYLWLRTKNFRLNLDKVTMFRLVIRFHGEVFFCSGQSRVKINRDE